MASRDSQAKRDQHSYLPLREHQFALTAGARLLEVPSADPLALVTVFGGLGSGKSHLCRHLVAEALERRPDWKTQIVSIDELTRQLHSASTQGRIRALQHRLRTETDLLVIEDLHHLATRRETQQQIVALLDERHLHHRPTLLTSRDSPGEIAGLSSRIVSRCHGGVLAELPPPGLASRKRLVAHFADANQIPLPQPLVEMLAQPAGVLPGELLHDIVDLRQIAQRRRISIDETLVREVLARSHDGPVTIAEITRLVAREFAARVSDLRSAGRSQGVVLPRQIAMFLARELLGGGAEYKAIGAYFGGRNHATVIHACEKIRELLKSDADTAARVTRIREALRR